MCPHRDSGNHAPTAPASALDGPEQIGKFAGINNANGAVGSDDFRFKQTSGRRSKTFREISKAPTLDQPGHADFSAAAALHVAAAFSCDCVVEINPHGARFSADCRNWSDFSGTAFRYERVMQYHAVHRACPNQ